MDPIERVAHLFEKFPGIGPRQAGRFVQYLLRSSPALRRELVHALQDLGGSVIQCSECMRFFASSDASSGRGTVCSICTNPERDLSQLAVIASDADLFALQRSDTYRGHYFVLGGTIHLTSENADRLRIKLLLASIPERIEAGLSEVILAFPANPEGDATAVRVREDVAEKFPDLRVTTLGRGLSTGSELEYADPETLRSALDSRR
jgi:recombination protein RecR